MDLSNKNLPKRALRRHHRERFKKRVSKSRQAWLQGAKNKARVLGILTRTRTLCSCGLCGNPRRYSKEESIQERRHKEQKIADLTHQTLCWRHLEAVSRRFSNKHDQSK